MASRVLEKFTCQNLHLNEVFVNGFAEEKLQHDIGYEYTFAVEVSWSDGRICYVRRTYRDFLKFYQRLSDAQKYQTVLNGLSNADIPRLKGFKWYQKYDRRLAESREEELNQFVHQLLQRNPQITDHVLVLEFFEQRSSDPVPGVSHQIHRRHPPHYRYIRKVSNHLQCCLL